MALSIAEVSVGKPASPESLIDICDFAPRMDLVQVFHSRYSRAWKSTKPSGAARPVSDSLTFRLLRYIKASAETLNFTRAAEQVFVAQSSLSHQIGKLESNIDVAIFDRLQNGLKLTPAGRIVAAYAENTLRQWEQMLAMARAVQRNEVPPLRLGFSSFINAKLLEKFREGYESMFSGCAIQLLSGDPLLSLQRLDARTLDCAILPLPIDSSLYSVQQIAQSPLVVCMRSDDTLADHAQIDIHEVAQRITVFRDPELHPSAHSRLMEMFAEVGIPIHLACSARTPTEIQWMVKERFGLALIDQLSPLDSGLITRPIVGLNWTADTAFVYLSQTDHVALPFIERFLQETWRDSRRRRSPLKPRNPEQLELLA
jgi:DNA-binding transcriptional LysR family regulator